MEIEKCNGITIINDSYNASYDSMKVSIEYLKSTSGNRKIAVLGDMLELGEFSKDLHTKVGEEVAKNEIDILVTVGENATFINKKAKELNKNIEEFHFDNNKEAGNYLNSIKKDGDIILFKASNGMKFSQIIDYIK